MIKKIVYISQQEIETLRTTGTITVGSEVITLENKNDYDIRVKFPFGVKANGTEIPVDADGKVNLTGTNMQNVVDDAVKGSENYQNVTMYEVGSTTAHHYKMYIEPVD